MAANVGKVTVRQVKPLLSVDRGEAKRRVINLYKAWYRQIPYSCKYFLKLNFWDTWRRYNAVCTNRLL